MRNKATVHLQHACSRRHVVTVHISASGGGGKDPICILLLLPGCSRITGDMESAHSRRLIGLAASLGSSMIRALTQ